MKTRIVCFLSISSLTCALALIAGCPVPTDLSTQEETDQSDTRPTPGAGDDCLVEVIVQGSGDVEVQCDASGRRATLTATPAEGFRFDRFIGSASDSNTIVVATGEDVVVTAVFVSLSDDEPVDSGTDPDPGTVIDNENGNDNAIDNGNENENENENTNENENGNDNGASQLLEIKVIGGIGSGFYDRDEVVTITALVPEDQQFDKWVGDTELIISGTVTSTIIQVRVTTNINLIATFVNAPTDAVPPKINIVSIPASPQIAPNLTVFDREPVTITLDIDAGDGPNDQVRVFIDRDGQFDPDAAGDEVFLTQNFFSFTTTVQFDVATLDKNVSYAIGVMASDGLNTTQWKYASGRIRRSTLPQVFWVGSIDPPAGAPAQSLPGLILEGVNVEDNAGSDFAGGEDFTGDGVDDFVVVSRYGKPQFVNPSGVGVGEGYLVAGSSNRRTGRRSLNATSSPQLPGVVFRGIDALDTNGQPSDDTDGLSAVVVAPDVDGDGISELIFGVPFAQSSGGGGILDKRNQFSSGGIVMVSSKTSGLGAFTHGARIPLDLVGQWFEQRRLFGDDMPVPEPENSPLPIGGIGQSPCFDSSGAAFTLPENGGIPDVHGWYVDILEYDEGEQGDLTADPIDLGECAGCVRGEDEFGETWIEPNHGFAYQLTDVSRVFGALIQECGFPALCPANDQAWANPPTTAGPEPASAECPLALASVPFFLLEDPTAANASCDCANMLPQSNCPVDMPTPNVCSGGEIGYQVGSGFYPDQIYNDEITEDDQRQFVPNLPLSPFGARVIGKDDSDRFGTSIAISNGTSSGSFFVVASAPTRTGSVGETPALITAPSLQEQCQDGSGCQLGVFGCDGGFALCGAVPNSGVAYMFHHQPYWEPAPSGNVPPKPHQYLVDGFSYAGQPNPAFMQIWDFDGGNEEVARPPRRVTDEFAIETPRAGVTIVGREDENIEVLAGIPDINLDSRDDLAIGAPSAGGDNGALYLVYRRNFLLEGDFVLEKLTLGFDDPIRLDGAFITGSPQNGVPSMFGSDIAWDFDFNGDGVPDIVVGAPGIQDDQSSNGEAIIIFGGNLANTPLDGATVNELIGRGEAARIRGMHPAGQFGFNVANAGDVDGDGRNDLLVSAPNAWPVFDPDPFDTSDMLLTASVGLDLNHDGKKDDVSGPQGRPDGSGATGPNNDPNDDLINAGLVYLILGSNDLSNAPGGTIDIADLGKDSLKGAIFAGRRGDRSGGALKGDYLGGGNAEDATQGGNVFKAGRFGRGRGLAGIGDIDNDGKDDFILGSILADTRVDATGNGVKNAGEAYVIYGFKP